MSCLKLDLDYPVLKTFSPSSVGYLQRGYVVPLSS